MSAALVRRVPTGGGLLLALSLMMPSLQAEQADWEIDPEHFSIVFGADHVGYQQQLGMFLEGSGSFRFDPETGILANGRVEIQADSVFTNHEDRDDHLRGRDFLNVRRNPLIVFQAANYVPNEEDASFGTLNGSLTMLGETHPVELDVVINKRERYPFGHRQEILGISAHTVITRSLWGMDYGVSDELVGDEVSLRFEFEAIRQ